MKRIAKTMFMTLSLIGMAIPACAIEDTVVVVQKLSDIHRLECLDLSKATILSGDENQVRMVRSMFNNEKNLVQRGDKLKLTGYADVELVLKPSSLVAIKSDDISQVTVSDPTVFASTVTLGAQSSSSITVPTSRAWSSNEVTISTENVANVTLGDSAHIDKMVIVAEDISAVNLGYITGNVIEMYIEDMAKVDNSRVAFTEESRTVTESSDTPASFSDLLNYIRSEILNDVDEDAMTDENYADRRLKSDTKHCDTKHNVIDKVGLNFLWGFTNWGDSWYGGLQSVEGPNKLRTTFSSYSLELVNHLYFGRHWSFDMGIGYESDVYKFTNPLVLYDPMANAFAVGTRDDATSVYAAASNLDDWSTRFVTRYINIPIGFTYKFSENYGLSLTAIPGLNYSGKHTGLKHRYKAHGTHYEDQSNVASEEIEPFKCDIRLTFHLMNIASIYLQVPTMPVAEFGGQKLYPIKIGIIF